MTAPVTPVTTLVDQLFTQVEFGVNQVAPQLRLNVEAVRPIVVHLANDVVRQSDALVRAQAITRAATAIGGAIGTAAGTAIGITIGGPFGPMLGAPAGATIGGALGALLGQALSQVVDEFLKGQMRVAQPSVAATTAPTSAAVPAKTA